MPPLFTVDSSATLKGRATFHFHDVEATLWEWKVAPTKLGAISDRIRGMVE